VRTGDIDCYRIISIIMRTRV